MAYFNKTNYFSVKVELRASNNSRTPNLEKLIRAAVLISIFTVPVGVHAGKQATASRIVLEEMFHFHRDFIGQPAFAILNCNGTYAIVSQ